MKKLFALLIALMLVLSLAACGDNNKPDADKNNPGTSQTDNQGGGNSNNNTTDNGNNSEPPNTPADQWSNSKYAEYTNGIEEPSFNYTIKGVIMDQLAINAEATLDEINAWKQDLLDAGFEEYREGERWGIKNSTHNVQMNGYVDGVAFIYISSEN